MWASEQSCLVVSERSGGLYFFVQHWWAKLSFFCRLVEPCELVDIVWDSVWKDVNKAPQNIGVYAEITLDFFSDVSKGSKANGRYQDACVSRQFSVVQSGFPCN